jgi:hypothetical protein
MAHSNVPERPPNVFASGTALQPYIDASGMPIAFKNILPALQKYRSIHEDTIEELSDSLKRGWNPSYSMIVVKVGSNAVRVVDGSHRYASLSRLFRKTPPEIHGDYPVQCTVLRENTPPRILTALAGKTNMDNESYQKMTLPDRVYYLVIVIKEAIHAKNLDYSAECLWTISSTEIQTALQDGSGTTVQIAQSKSVLDGLVALVRQWVTAHDATHWGAPTAKHELFASLWQNIAFLNERGSAFWFELYKRWIPFSPGGSVPGPPQEAYAAELKKNGIVSYTSMYPGICNDGDYARKALDALGPKHMRAKYEYLFQRLAGHFLLTGKTVTRAFTESITKHWTEKDTLEGDLYALWLSASEVRKKYNSTMAGTIWHSMSECDWPLCPGDSSTAVRRCDICDAYSACGACSQIDALHDSWPSTKLYMHMPDASQSQMAICPVCAVCFVLTACTSGNNDLVTDDGTLRVLWPTLAAKADKSAADECITCCVGLACLVHGSKPKWSKAPGEFKVEELSLKLQEWFRAQHRVVIEVFQNLASRTYLAEAKRKFTLAREVEIRLALGSTDLGLWTQIDATRRPKPGKNAPAILHSTAGQVAQSAMETKLAVYNQMILEATPSGPNRSIRIEHSTWQKWWEAAKSDESQKGKYSFVYLDPMYDDFPTSSDFELLRALIYYVTTPGAVILLFHGFVHLVAYARKLCESSTKKTVRHCTQAHSTSPFLVFIGSKIAHGAYAINF